MLLLSFFSAIKRHQGAPLRVYRKMMSESGSQSVVLYACVCLWSSTFESRLYNLLCLDSQPFLILSRTFEPHWQKAQSFPQSQTEPCTPVIWPPWTLMLWRECVQCGQKQVWVAKVNWACLGSCRDWAKQCYWPHPAMRKHYMAAISTNLACRSLMHTTRKEGKHLFLSQLGNMSMNKSHEHWFRTVWEK